MQFGLSNLPYCDLAKQDKCLRLQYQAEDFALQLSIAEFVNLGVKFRICISLFDALLFVFAFSLF